MHAGDHGKRQLPSTYRRVDAPGGVHQADAFDPSVKHFPRAMRAGEPVFDDNAVGTRWRAARRMATEHVLGVIAASPWADHLVLRGSVLLRAWLGPEARDPGDLDFVVTPLTMMLDDRRTAQLLDGIVAAVRESPRASPEVTIDAEESTGSLSFGSRLRNTRAR